jgi:hypothetical protein
MMLKIDQNFEMAPEILGHANNQACFYFTSFRLHAPRRNVNAG